MFEDEERERRLRVMRSFLMRSLLQLPSLDLAQRLFRTDKDEEMFFRMASVELDRENLTGPARPIIRGVPKRAHEYTDAEMYSRFRFTRAEFRSLFLALNVPNRFRFKTWSFDGEEAFLLFLKRMASTTTFEKLRDEFRRDECELCACFNGFTSWFIDTHGWLITGNFNVTLHCV